MIKNGFIILLAFGITIYSQILLAEESCLYDNSESYNGLILLKNGNKILSDDIQLRNDFIIYQIGKSYQDTIELEKVNLIRANIGNYAVEGSLLGGLFFLVLDLYFDYSIDGTINNSAEHYAIATGIGAGIGLIAAIGFGEF